MKKKQYLIIIVSLVFCACIRPVIYSEIPEIRFIGFEKYQEKLMVGGDSVGEINGAILSLYFQDGDGDIGLNGNDTFPPFNSMSPYHYNLICDYYEKQNGVFFRIDSMMSDNGIKPFTFSSRIPRLSNLPEESIHGEIILDMNSYYINSPYDTIKLEFYIYDRKLNKSNVEEVVTTKGIKK